MFVYEKRLQYPVKIKNTNPKLASLIISQYGGPDGELGASLRYLSQRYSMPYPELKGLLTDIGIEELGHLEMIGAIVHQLTRDLTEEQIRTAGFDAYFVDHTAGVYPTAASGSPWNAAGMAVKGDLIKYTSVVLNTGSLPLSNVIFTDDIPAGTTFVSGSVSVNGISQPSYNPATDFALANLAVGNSTTGEFDVTVN